MTEGDEAPAALSRRPPGDDLRAPFPELLNRVVAKYTLRDTNKPMGVAEYQLVEVLPKDLESSLPNIEQIEHELGEVEE